MRANKYFLLFIFSIFASCSQGGKGNNFAKTKEDFGPKKQDTIVSQKANTIKKIDWHYAGWISTHEFMQSLVTLFEFAPESKVPFEMLDKYYSNPNTTTTVDIANGTYVEAALGIYGPDIFNSITESNIKNYSLIKKSFDNWDTMIPQGLTPSQVVARLIGFLKQLPAHLIKNGVSVSVSKGVGNSIEKYVDILNTTKDRLSFIKTNKSEGMLAYNLTIIQDTLSDLIKSGIVTKDSMAPTMESLKFPLGLLPKFQEKTHKNISYILFSILLQKRNEYLLKLGKEDISSLTAEEVSALVLEFPKTMQDFATNFVSESDEAISWYMKGEYAAFSSPLRSIYLNRLLSKLEESDAEKMLLEIEYQISTTVYNQLLSVLYDKTRTLPNTVEVIVVSQFSRSEQHFYYDFYNQIKKIAADRIKEDLLSGEAKFPGIEGKYVYWPIEDTKSTYKSYFLTGAKEIGSSIQANIFFLENINATSSLPDSDKKFKTYTFSLLNRLLAIFGYRNFHGVLSNSLHQRFTPTKSANFDIYSYDVEPGIYALPDNLLLDYGYKTSGKIDQRLVQTVSGRASLLKASAKLIDFFADYNHNSFD
ncbi:MAG: hypothetical protein KDD37_07580, partial [Bdellovibrionales bacterium]|nr:hypothetical protein [Bdellovibrionales bacterium]